MLPPAVALFLLSPAIGELLSGSSPPAEFFNPFNFGLLASLYGSGAVIMRELRIRWKKGVGSLLLLGAAYGVIEEGLMVTSFFSPYWVDLGPMAVYGRWIDVNWVWAEMLTIYHAVYSITIPVLLVELAYPERRSERWISNKAFAFLLGLLVLVVVLGFFLFSTLMNYWTPLLQYLLGIGLVAAFVYLARKLPAPWGHGREKKPPRPLVLWIVSSVGGLAFFIGFWSSPHLFPWPAAMMYGFILIFLMARIIARYDWSQCPNRMHVFAFCSGALTFMILFAALQELDKNRTDVTAGMTVVAVAFAVGLFWLGRRVKHQKTLELSDSKVLNSG